MPIEDVICHECKRRVPFAEAEQSWTCDPTDLFWYCPEHDYLAWTDHD